ncbi:hypothetical protein F750_1167 [Streptomyces sp. PAMC 26508]|nr:hypothetical protein F750_1167 [Streptomyces sp. PAMC 26508]
MFALGGGALGHGNSLAPAGTGSSPAPSSTAGGSPQTRGGRAS